LTANAILRSTGNPAGSCDDGTATGKCWATLAHRGEERAGDRSRHCKLRDHIFNEIQLPKADENCWPTRKHYSAVLAFEHPTVSISPVLNALDLSEHSRLTGTAAWISSATARRVGRELWMHVVDSRPCEKRCVFVGSPLQGTNLANRRSCAIRCTACLLWPRHRQCRSRCRISGVAHDIIKVAASVVDFTAKTPFLDAAVAMIPGLAAQSSTQNNQDLIRLNARKSHRQGAPSTSISGRTLRARTMAGNSGAISPISRRD